MYQWVENTIGLVPSGYEWIYGVGVIVLYLAFIIMVISPIIIILNISKKRKR